MKLLKQIISHLTNDFFEVTSSNYYLKIKSILLVEYTLKSVIGGRPVLEEDGEFVGGMVILAVLKLIKLISLIRFYEFTDIPT